MPDIVIDASALLALLNAEQGADDVATKLPGAIISAVNLSEVAGKLGATGMPEKEIHQALDCLGLRVLPFDEEQAYLAGALRAETDGAGLSLGDRACLALAQKLGLAALTADRNWSKLKLGVTVRIIR